MPAQSSLRKAGTADLLLGAEATIVDSDESGVAGVGHDGGLEASAT